MLKVIKGNRDELEVEALKTIWLGKPEDADRLIERLSRKPDVKLRLVGNASLDARKPATKN
jgi:hypothetical protein